MRGTCFIACVLHWQKNKSLSKATNETNGFRHPVWFTFTAKVLLEATLAEIDATCCNDGPFPPEVSQNTKHSILERSGQN